MFPLFAALSLAAVPALAQTGASAPAAASAVAVKAGKPLYVAGGKRLGSVYRVRADGSPQLIVDGRIVTVPAATLSLDGTKVVTSLSKGQVFAAR